MKYLSLLILTAISFFRPDYCNAQLAVVKMDSLVKPGSHTSLPQKNIVRPYIIPSALLVYGVLSLNLKPLKNWNETIRNVTAAPNGHQTNIDNYLQFAPAVASHVISLMGVKAKHKLFDRLMIDGMTAALSTTVVYIIKNNSNETRPDGSDNFSFPSSHVATAFASAELLRQEYGAVSPWYGIAGYAVASITGYLRLYNNRHWFGDVLEGAGIGILSAKIATGLFPLAKRILFKNKTPFTAIIPSYQNGNLAIHIIHEIK